MISPFLTVYRVDDGRPILVNAAQVVLVEPGPNSECVALVHATGHRLVVKGTFDETRHRLRHATGGS